MHADPRGRRVQIIEELKRRKVFRAGISYLVAAWVVLQVGDIAAESFQAPPWVMQALFAGVIAGFFLVLVLAWAYQLTSEGLKPDREVPRATAARSGPWAPIAFVVLLGAVGYLLYERVADPPASAASPPAGDASVAVLPFVNMSASQENEYFSDGLTDTLLNMLSQVPGLKVAARTSSFAFKGTSTDIRTIAEQLAVDHVLEGSVQRAGNTVRITAQLVQAGDGYPIWSATFDRDLEDIFTVQDEIAGEVARALRGSLLSDEQLAATNDGGTDDPEAYDAYLRGREKWRGNTERELAESVTLLRKAVTLDPNFALAWSALAEAINDHTIVAGLAWSDVEDEMRAAARRAVELAPNHSVTVAVQGWVLEQFGERREARKWLERALEIDPQNVWAWSRLSDHQFASTEFEAAVASAERAMALDPLDYKLKADSTHKYLQVDRVPEAERLAQSVLDHDPDSNDGLSALGNVYWRTGRYPDAYRIYHRMLRQNPNLFYVYDRVSDMYRDLNALDEAERWLDRAAQINPERVRWPRSFLCRQQGRGECALSLWRELLEEADEEEVQLRLIALIAMEERDWDRARQALERMIELGDARGSAFGGTWRRMDLALVADRLGDEALRDELLDGVLGRQQADLDKGQNSQYTWRWVAEVHAMRGQAGPAVEALRRAHAAGFRRLDVIEHGDAYEKIRKDPAVQAFIEEFRSANDELLQELRAVAAGLGAVQEAPWRTPGAFRGTFFAFSASWPRTTNGPGSRPTRTVTGNRWWRP